MDRKTADIQFRKLLLGSRKEPLTGVELDALLQGTPSSEFILQLLVGLKNKNISADQLLIKAISNARAEDDLLPVALALRFGASPNLYVNVDNVGVIHIIGFSYIKLQGSADTPVINAIIIMLKASGTKSVNPIFDTKGGGIKTESELIAMMSVDQWLSDQGYGSILPLVEDSYDQVQPTFLTKIGSLLDRMDLIITPVSLPEIIKDHSSNVLTANINQVSDAEYSLGLALRYLNLTAFEMFLDHGMVPDYVFVNRMLIQMKVYRRDQDGLSYTQVREMLEASIIRGIQLDHEQFTLLTTIDSATADDISKKYQKPYWQKTCSVTGAQATDELKLLAFSLNIDPTSSKETICQNLAALSKADPSALKGAAIRRQMTRISSDVTSIEDFLTRPDLRKYLCRNRTLTDRNPYEYNDIDISYYKDDGGAVWCFTSDQFDRLRDNKTNPYTGERLSDMFMEGLSRQRNMVKRLGITTTDVKTYSEAIDDLTKRDTISNKNSEQITRAFTDMAHINGVSQEELNNLSQRQMTAVLLSLGNNTDLRRLTLSHAKITFYRIGYRMIRDKSDIAASFFNNLKAVMVQ